MIDQRPQLRLLALALASILAVAGLAACQPNSSVLILVTATPRAEQQAAGPADEFATPSGPVIQTPAPEAAQPDTSLPTPTFIPTPNPTRAAVIDPQQDQVHVVQLGDTLNAIATAYGVTIESLMAANGLTDQDLLSVGQTLTIPLGVQAEGPDFKSLPDSELVYGPSLKGFNTEVAVAALPDSYLANYNEELNGRLWSGAEIVERVAIEQSISPRVLLTLLEYESGWLSQSTVDESAAAYPMGYLEAPAQVYGLYRQLDWAGKMLQTGYYGWRQRGLSAVLLADGTRVRLNDTLNAGTAAIQLALAQTRTYNDWMIATQHAGFFATYVSLFGDPFQRAVEPLIPSDLEQPEMVFPWTEDEVWYFTGGPHGAWGSSSAWAALDFVSTDQVGTGCEISEYYARAMADGIIARSEYGIVILDLDGDGFEGTGWTVYYLHVSSESRLVEEGQQVKQGDPLAHPACEAGVSYATHLHVARRYNGEWIDADCSECLLDAPSPQWNIDGWLAYSFQNEYDGALIKDEEYREACVCREPLNTFDLSALP